MKRKTFILVCILVLGILLVGLSGGAVGAQEPGYPGRAVAQAAPGTAFSYQGRPGDATQGQTPPGVSEDWWSAVQKDIRQSEYHISPLKETGQQGRGFPSNPSAAYQAPNRAHNLRTYFSPAGIRVIPRTEPTPTWEWGLALTGYGYAGDVQPVAAAELAVSANRIEYRRGELTEWYVNDERGLEQGFTLATAPQSPIPNTQHQIVFELALSGDLTPNLTEDQAAIEFITPGGVRVLRYSDLHAYDATGRALPAHFSLAQSHISISLDATDAVYPIAVDPLATTPNWTAELDQAGAQFGFSVSTAGDVNGDGYSDVIVGVPLYDYYATNEGAVFVYLGSETGLESSFAWWAESNQDSAQFGLSVGMAGDVNRDGYGDVIVGAPLYDNGQTNEGMVFVWLGSETGLGATGTFANADWKAESNQSSAFLGWSVSTAGDVNGDGYSDVIVGANQYTSGASQGRAFVWLGAANGLGADGTPSNADWWAESGSASQFAWSVGTAGDVNGDGYDDVIIGSPLYDNGQMDEGGVFVWYGGSGDLGANGNLSNVDWRAESNQTQAGMDRPEFGWSVGTAGDVNGDGYSDVIVGAPFYENDDGQEGRVFAWHGGLGGLGDSGTPANADWWEESDQAGAGFGGSVSTAGDVNGDGYADVIIGADWYTNNEISEGRAFVYHGSSTGLTDTADWTDESDQTSARYGISVGVAGDVNGDGYSDVIVGAFLYDGGQNDEGRVYVYHGSAASLSTTAGWTAESNQADAQFGFSVSTAGDVNGDGYADVIVGAPFYDNGQTDEGRAYVYHGSAAGLSTTANWMAESDHSGAQFGNSVGTAGDVNGDGYDDIIVGAYYYDHGQAYRGKVYVYYGSTAGLNATAVWTTTSIQTGAGYYGASVGTAGDVNGDGYADAIIGASHWAFVYYGSAVGLSATADWIVESDQFGSWLGWSVGTAGDVNGDGYADVIVGAHQYSNGQENEGRAYVYHGSASGLSATADWITESDQVQAYFGRSVGSAGDVNGDGYSDVIVGAYWYDNGQENEGRAFVYHGSAAGLSATADWIAESNENNTNYGWSLGTAGDVNGDGYADVIVGAHMYNGGVYQEGRAFVYHGSVAGLSATADWTAESDYFHAHFGTSVGTAGDVNGDGYADVIVGAPYYDNGEDNEGRAFVYYGNAGDGLALTPRQMRTDGSAPIALLGASDSATEVQLCLTGRSPLGREQVKLQWQVAPLGTPFSDPSVNSGTSASWMDTGVGGVEISQNVAGLTTGTAYHWRARLLYRPGNRLGQSASRWLTIPWNGWTEQDFRTQQAISGLAASNDGPTSLGSATTLRATVTGGTSMTYAWTFGDGEVGSGSLVTHTYPATGAYTATVTASNSINTLDASTSVVVNDAPIAGLSATNDSPTELGSATTFTAATTSGSNASYTWAFGDGQSGSGAVTTYTYQSPGDYTAIVTASNSVSLVTATTDVTVNPVVGQATWTFILYFAGDNNLYPHLEDAVDELEQVADKSNVNILVLLDGQQNGDTHVYHVQYDTAPGIASPPLSVVWNPGELNTGNVQTLVDFANWARTSYPADYYFLSIADHGRGTTGIAWDDTSGGDNLSAYAELESALGTISSAGGKIDVLYLDACLMGMIEDAYEIKDDVDYVVASENLGWSVFAYQSYVSSMSDDTTPRQLAQNVADAYLAALQGFYPGTVSALDMSVIESVGDATNTFAQALMTYLDGANISQVISVRNNVQTFDSRNYQVLDSSDEYVDLYHLAELVQVSIGDATVQSAAQGVRDAIDNCAVAEHHQSGYTLWSRNYWDLDDAHGIAIYFPPQSGGWDYANYVTGGSWAFGSATQWDEFLIDYFSLTGLPPETPTDPGVPTMLPVDETIAGLVATNGSPTMLGSVTTLTATIAAGDNVSYTWAFGDGDSGSGAVVTHTYPSSGVYTAIVTASNHTNVLTATTTVTITDVSIAGLAATNNSPTTLGNTTTLTATITAGSNVSYTWNFGDQPGNGSTLILAPGAIVTHTYQAAGVYTAVVTASNKVSLLTAMTTVTIESELTDFYVYLPLVLRTP